MMAPHSCQCRRTRCGGSAQQGDSRQRGTAGCSKSVRCRVGRSRPDTQRRAAVSVAQAGAAVSTGLSGPVCVLSFLMRTNSQVMFSSPGRSIELSYVLANTSRARLRRIHVRTFLKREFSDSSDVGCFSGNGVCLRGDPGHAGNRPCPRSAPVPSSRPASEPLWLQILTDILPNHRHIPKFASCCSSSRRSTRLARVGS